jgi:hypothetical protein
MAASMRMSLPQQAAPSNMARTMWITAHTLQVGLQAFCDDISEDKNNCS